MHTCQLKSTEVLKRPRQHKFLADLISQKYTKAGDLATSVFEC